MKKSIISIAALALVMASASAQDVRQAAAAAAAAISQAEEKQEVKAKPNYWTSTLKTNINFGQTGLTNWAAGGDNTTSLAAYIDGNANYKKDINVNNKTKNIFWNNRLQLDYGFLYASSKPILQKNTDRIYLESKFGYQLNKKLYFSANFDFKSQFSRGYTYNTPSGVTPANPDGTYSSEQWQKAAVPKSGFMSPGYTNIALGIDWKPTNFFSISLAPVTGGVVTAIDPEFRKSYSMSVKNSDDPAFKAAEEAYNKEKSTENLIALGKFYRSARFEFGTQLKVDYKLTINDNFSYTTQAVFFSNYLDEPTKIRTNWDNRFDWKLAKYFTLTFTTNLIYDPKVLMEKDGEWVKRGVQFKESIAFGFTYMIASKKK